MPPHGSRSVIAEAGRLDAIQNSTTLSRHTCEDGLSHLAAASDRALGRAAGGAALRRGAGGVGAGRRGKDRGEGRGRVGEGVWGTGKCDPKTCLFVFGVSYACLHDNGGARSRVRSRGCGGGGGGGGGGAIRAASAGVRVGARARGRRKRLARPPFQTPRSR